MVYFDGVQLFNASGQRISKTVNGTTYNYHYLGDQLVEMTWGSNRMRFSYDAIGAMSVNYNGTDYFYLRNAQGDVTGLVDSAGTKVVSYAYDPWGKTWDASGTLASTLGTFNPLRYRATSTTRKRGCTTSTAGITIPLGAGSSMLTRRMFLAHRSIKPTGTRTCLPTAIIIQL